MKIRVHTLFLVAIVLAAAAAQGAALLDIGAGVGAVRLGVNDQGHLNALGGLVNSSRTGLAINLSDPGHTAGYYDSTSPGCFCEGWGVSGSGHAGYANVSVDGVANLVLEGGGLTGVTATTAVSTVHLASLPGLKVVQDYHAAPGSPTDTFEDTVTISNTTGATVTSLRYRRVMDWDVPYTEFSEAVTIGGWPAANLVFSSDNGFGSANPLSGPSSLVCPVSANFVDCAPGADHGALFDFSFGDLADGESKTFKIFYGAALSEAGAFAALAAVGAEVYSLGQSDLTGGDPVAGTPATYFFGFAGVGGTPVVPVPEPSSVLLLMIPALAVASRLRRKFSGA